MDQPIRRIVVPSPFGPLSVTEQGDAITALDWGRLPGEGPSLLLETAAEQLEAYFDGRLKLFDLPLAPQGTAHQLKVWQAMQAIPYGETMTYGELALGIKSVARAVGTACGANPIPIIIPCHRVVGENSLGGFSGLGGIASKRRLLALENDGALPRRQPSLFDLPLFSYTAPQPAI